MPQQPPTSKDSASRPRRCVHQLYEDHVRRAPDAVAVVHGRDRLTYLDCSPP